MTTLATIALAAGLISTGGNNGWICSTLDNAPNTNGVLIVIQKLVDKGYTADNGGPQVLVGTVVSQCPEYLPVLQKAVDQYGG